MLICIHMLFNITQQICTMAIMPDEISYEYHRRQKILNIIHEINQKKVGFSGYIMIWQIIE